MASAASCTSRLDVAGPVGDAGNVFHGMRGLICGAGHRLDVGSQFAGRGRLLLDRGGNRAGDLVHLADDGTDLRHSGERGRGKACRLMESSRPLPASSIWIETSDSRNRTIRTRPGAKLTFA